MRLLSSVLILFAVVFLVGCKASHQQSKMKENSSKAQKSAQSSKKSYSSNEVPSVEADQVSCKLGADERKIVRRKPESGGCEVVYIKAMEEKVVATAQNDLSYCGKVMGRVQQNLVDAGFTCASL